MLPPGGQNSGTGGSRPLFPLGSPRGGAARPPIPPGPPGPPAPPIPPAAAAAAMAAAARSTRLTGRAALLAVVVCAIALSLAYPVREYIAQRQQIDQLLAQQQTMSAQVKALQEQGAELGNSWYVEQRARDELHMCFPGEQCYVVISGQPAPSAAARRAATPPDPWYAKLWASVQRADAEPSR